MMPTLARLRCKRGHYRFRIENPDTTMTSRREYQRAYRATHPRTLERRSAHVQTISQHRFIGIDGEGWNVDDRHEYTMIATSETMKLYTGAPLTTEECLEFISTLPLRTRTFYVSFFFDYDVTMILRDFAQIAPETAYKLFEDGTKYVWWRGYGIKYRPHKAFTVCKRGRKPVTIHDTQGFFQSSFVAALRKYGIGDDETLTTIETMKDQRSSFEPEDAMRILEYSQLECALLVDLIGHIRDAGAKAKLSPFPYEGPGGLASSALRRYWTKAKHQQVIDKLPPEFEQIMLGTMYGGRFETLCVGNVDQPVNEYDLSSAYPYAMSNLPCLIHGRWSKTRKNHGELAVSHIRFEHTGYQYQAANPLPVRQRDGTLFFPATGSGWYWRHEYEINDDPQWRVDVETTYSWVPDGCNCQPFSWVRDLYHQRQEMEREHKGSGIALKLTLNTLYGKMAQRRPVPGAWLNMVYASLITSKTRRRIYDAYRQCGQGNVIMFATDAIFTVNGAMPTIGEGLGAFEPANVYENLSVIQPGVYFSDGMGHFKTRGVPKKVMQAHARELIVAAELGETVEFEMKTFHGLRMSLANHSPELIGQWGTQTRKVDTRLVTKRINEIESEGIKWNYPAINTFGESTPLSPIGNIADVERAISALANDDETTWAVE